MKLWFIKGYIGFQLAAFMDFGHAWNTSEEFDLDNFITGYGVGFRLLLPGLQIAIFGDFGHRNKTRGK